MAILVCGGAGYIGSHFVDYVKRQGEEVIVVDNLSTGHKQAVANVLLYTCDIQDSQAMDDIFRQHEIDSVVHFAAFSLVGESMKNPLKYFQNNVCATNQLLQTMNRHHINRLIFSSSAAVYGEARGDLIVESDATCPTNAYGESKLMMERIIDWASRTSDLRYIALRYFNVAGASPVTAIGEDHRPESHLIPLAIQASLRQDPIYLFGDDYPTPDGTCIRDYIHVQDLVEAHYLALKALRNDHPSTTYNLGYGRGYSVREILDAVSDFSDQPLEIQLAARRPGDPARLVASNAKICRELGWRPRFDRLEDIIATAYRWHESHPQGYSDCD